MPSASYVKVGGLDTVALAFNQLSATWRSAAAVTLNNTQRDVINQATIKQMRSFQIRVRPFDLPPDPVPASWRATPDRLQAVMALATPDSPLGARRTQIFNKFGAAQQKAASDPRQPIAIPTKALRPQPGVLVPRSMYVNKILPGGVDISPARLTKKGKVSRAGGLYFVLGKPGQKDFGAYRRTDDPRHPVQMLWAFRTSIKIPHRLDFESDSEKVIEARWQINWDEAWARASGSK